MANDRKFPGQILAMLYPSRTGLTSRSMPLDEQNIAQLQQALQSAGPGAKIALKPTSEKYRAEKEAQMRSQGKKGNAPAFILEVLNAQELNEERERMNAQNSGDASL